MRKQSSTYLLVLAAILVVIAGGCQPTNSGLPPTSAGAAAVAASATPVASATQPPPSATWTPAPPSATPTPAATATPQAYGPTNFPPGINPLTGLPASDPALLERRPVDVKVQLFPRSGRPAYGISKADNIWEYYQNGGLTRMHTIFYGNNADHVRPIRSARLFDAQIIRMYKSIFAFGGADQRILNQLMNSEFADRLVLEGGSKSCPPMCREEPNTFNFLWTNTAELQKYITAKGVANGRQNLDGLVFDPQAPAKAETAPGKRINTRYSISAYSQWDYDPAQGKYVRQQDTIEASTPQEEKFEPMIDGATGQSVSADNVMVVLAEHQLASEFTPVFGPNSIIRVNLEGEGDAYAFRDGQAYKLRWHRANPEGLISFTFPDGTPYAMKPGNTWFEVMGQTSGVQTPETGWRFQYSFP